MEKTLKAACEKWVGTFNAIESRLLKRAFEHNREDFTELTTPVTGETVDYHGSLNLMDNEFVIDSVNADEQTVCLALTNESDLEAHGETVTVPFSDVEVNYDDWLPMWGTLWTLEGIDERWVQNNLTTVSECGFRIYEDEESGTIYLGIDGAGYNFYDGHWMSLYEARGLQWHQMAA